MIYQKGGIIEQTGQVSNMTGVTALGKRVDFGVLYITTYV